MNERKNIKGFFSYARQNDKHNRGNLSSLRNLLEIELREQTGENIDIFQDLEDIAWGEFWKKKIIASLDSSKFLIAIVTPSYLRSESCRFELEYFLSLEKVIGSERILPLIYIDTPELKNIKDPIFSELNNRQYFDVTKLRLSSLKSTSSKRQLEKFSRRIRELIVEEIYFTSNNETNTNTLSSVIPTTAIKSKLHSSSQKEEDRFPPPPTNFPDGWDKEWQPSFEEAAIAAKPAPKLKKKDENAIPSMYVPLVTNIDDKNHPPQQITIVLQPTGDEERDKRRIKTLYGTLISYHGKDKFRFEIINKGKRQFIDFVHDTTRICPELLNRLKKLIGEEAWRVEEITFQ